MNEMIRIAPGDAVAVALKPLKAGETVSWGTGKLTLNKKISKCTIYVTAKSKANKNRKAKTKTIKIVVR